MARAFDKEGENWQQWLSNYFLSVQQHIYEDTKNAAVFESADVPLDPEYFKELDEMIARGSGDILIYSTYLTKKEIQEKIQSADAHERLIYENSLRYKEEVIGKNFQEFRQLPAPIKRKVLYSRSKEFRELYNSSKISDLNAYIEALIKDEYFYTQVLSEYYIVDYYLTGFPQEEMDQPLLNEAQTKRGGKKIEREVGKLGLTVLVGLIPGGQPVAMKLKEVFKFVEKAQETLDKLGLGFLNPIIDKYFWKAIDDFGKAILTILGIIAGGLLALFAASVAILAKTISLLKGLSIGAPSGLLSGLAKGATATIPRMLSGAKGMISLAHSGLAALGPGLSFSGTIAIVSITGILVLDIFDDDLESAYILNSTETRMRSGIASEGCWPVSGDITGLTEYCEDSSPHLMYSATINDLSPNGAIDFSVGMDSDVFAPFPGLARYYHWDPAGTFGGYGNYVVLVTDIEGKEVVFIFGHLLDSPVSDSDWTEVNTGDIIASSDHTGRSTGPHLHFEIRGASFEEIYGEKYDELVCWGMVISDCSGEESSPDPSPQGGEE